MALITVFSLREPDQVSKTEPWSGGPKSYLQQPVMATPVIQQKMEEPHKTAASTLLGLIRVRWLLLYPSTRSETLVVSIETGRG